MPNLISLTCPSLQILGKTQTGVFPISRFPDDPLEKYCCNSNDIDMKLEPVTKHDKGKKATSNKLDDGIMSANFDVIAIFLIYG